MGKIKNLTIQWNELKENMMEEMNLAIEIGDYETADKLRTMYLTIVDQSLEDLVEGQEDLEYISEYLDQVGREY